jgi:hypothetical protein
MCQIAFAKPLIGIRKSTNLHVRHSARALPGEKSQNPLALAANSDCTANLEKSLG